MSSTDLKLQQEGTLPRPGPIGRLVRLLLGAACLYYVNDLWSVRHDLMADNQSIIPQVWNGILVGLFLISYVINIGFSRNWKKWPAVVSALVFAALAGIGYLDTGSFETPLLARGVHSWELYLFCHLGLSFVMAALLGTPGCEMRAFHHAYSLVSGKPTLEHHCPVGPLGPIDTWEQKQSWAKSSKP